MEKKNDRLSKLLFQTEGVELLNIKFWTGPTPGTEENFRDAAADIISDVREGRTIKSDKFGSTGVKPQSASDFLTANAS